MEILITSSSEECLPNGKQFALEDDDWTAELLSLQPERSLKIPRISTSWDALALLYLLSHLEASFWITDDAHRQIAQKAYLGNYEGEWETVQFILEQYPKTPKEFYQLFLMRHSPEEFFGNLQRKARRLRRGLGTKARDPHGLVRRPQRHRGYRDKGTLRPAHRPAVEPPQKEERIDRRKSIGHPLLSNSKGNSNGEGHLPLVLRKGEENDLPITEGDFNQGPGGDRNYNNTGEESTKQDRFHTSQSRKSNQQETEN